MNFNSILIMVIETLGMVLISGLFAYLIGLPLGVLLNVTSNKGIKPCKWLNTVLVNYHMRTY